MIRLSSVLVPLALLSVPACTTTQQSSSTPERLTSIKARPIGTTRSNATAKPTISLSPHHENHLVRRYEADAVFQNDDKTVQRQDAVILSIVEVGFSDYELKKDATLKGKNYVTAILSTYAKNRRGVADQCKLAEESHSIIIGSKVGGVYQLHGTTNLESGFPLISTFLYLKSDGENLKGHLDYLWNSQTTGSTGERIEVVFRPVPHHPACVP